jgi:phosphopantothenoylcysteine decarboxylase/phosphopantothenate--cysteine ligase
VHILNGKRVLLAVGGGIAAYKTAELVRRLTAAGADVQVAMTRSAREFITPLTLQTLSRHPVATHLLDAGEEAAIGHIEIAERADVVLVAPATANLISRMAAGQAGDIVTAALLVTRAPVVVAPSMNTNMLSHPAVVANIERLASFGYRIVESDTGQLACGYEGRGRLPDPEELLAEMAAALTPQDLTGRHVLVSAGPTREAIDPVRYLSNRSSGRMGYEVAAEAWRRGARVSLVSGPTALKAPRGVEIINVESAAEMKLEIDRLTPSADAVVMVAAVADYRPAAAQDRKIKKTNASGTQVTDLALELEGTEDILGGLKAVPGERILVGFAAETHDLENYARGKLERKGLDLIVANDVTADGAGFEVATNRAILIDRQGTSQDSGLVGKDELSAMILDRVVRAMARLSA